MLVVGQQSCSVRCIVYGVEARIKAGTPPFFLGAPTSPTILLAPLVVLAEGAS